MTAPAIIETLREAGLNLSLTDKAGVKVAPASRLTDDLRSLIRAHKAELVDWLAAANDTGPAEPQKPELTGWRVTLAPNLAAATLAKFRAASEALDRLIAQAGEPTDSDRDCWPNGPAMNAGEIERFEARVTLFRRRGLTTEQAEAMVDKLLRRDREGDDRRLCLECRHLSGRRCAAWRVAGIGGPDVGDLRTKLQRCDGFELVPSSEVQP